MAFKSFFKKLFSSTLFWVILLITFILVTSLITYYVFVVKQQEDTEEKETEEAIQEEDFTDLVENYTVGLGEVENIDKNERKVFVSMGEETVEFAGEKLFFVKRTYSNMSSYKEMQITFDDLNIKDKVLLMRESDEEGNIMEASSIMKLVVITGNYDEGATINDFLGIND